MKRPALIFVFFASIWQANAQIPQIKEMLPLDVEPIAQFSEVDGYVGMENKEYLWLTTGSTSNSEVYTRKVVGDTSWRLGNLVNQSGVQSVFLGSVENSICRGTMTLNSSSGQWVTQFNLYSSKGDSDDFKQLNGISLQTSCLANQPNCSPWMGYFRKAHSNRFLIYLVAYRRLEDGSYAFYKKYLDDENGQFKQANAVIPNLICASNNRFLAFNDTVAFNADSPDFFNFKTFPLPEKIKWDARKGLFWKNDTLHVVWGDGRHLSTGDGAVSWQVDTLPFSNIKEFWKGKTAFFYATEFGIFKSENLSGPYTEIFPGKQFSSSKFIFFRPENQRIWISLPGIGIYYSDDLGQLWKPMNEGLPVSGLNSMLWHKGQFWGENGNLWHSKDGVEWAFFLDSSIVGVSAQRYITAGDAAWLVNFSNSQAAKIYHSNDGEQWDNCQTVNSLSNIYARFNGDPTGKIMVIQATSFTIDTTCSVLDSLQKSANYYHRIQEGLSVRSGDTLAIFHNDAYLHRTFDWGQTWDSIQLPTNDLSTRLFKIGNKLILITSQYSRTWISKNWGDTWLKVTDGFLAPNSSLNLRTYGGYLWNSTLHGTLVSSDFGLTWFRLNTDLSINLATITIVDSTLYFADYQRNYRADARNLLGVLNGLCIPDMEIKNTSDTFSCKRPCVLLKIEVSGGAPPYKFDWSAASDTVCVPGIYKAAVTDSKGCWATGEMTVFADLTQPYLITLKAEPSLSGDSTGKVSVAITGGAAPFQIRWSNGGVKHTLAGLPPGTYSVTVTDANDCILSGNIEVGQLVFTSLPNATDSWRLSPNPASGWFICSTNGLPKGRLTLFDLAGGRAILEKELVANETEIDVLSLPPGQYWVEIRGDFGIEIHKLILIK